MQINKSQKRIKWLVILLIFLIISYWYIVTPLGWDIRVMMSSAYLADNYFGGGINGIYHSWELKPIGNRLIIYIIYKLAILFSSFRDKIRFEMNVKLIWLIVITYFISLTWLLTRKLFTRIFKPISSNIYLLILLVPFIFSAYNITLQAEETALLLSLFSFGLILSKNKVLIIIAGFFSTIIFWIKGISIFFLLQTLYILYLYRNNFRNEINIYVKSLIIFLLLTLSLIYFLFPLELVGLYNSYLFQSQDNFRFLTALLLSIKNYFYVLPDNIIYIPAIGILVLLIANYLQQKKYKSLLNLLIMWLLGFIPVLIQNLYFNYHYLFLVIPAFYTLGSLFSKKTTSITNIIYRKYSLIIVPLFLVVLFFYIINKIIFFYLVVYISLFLIVSKFKTKPSNRKNFNVYFLYSLLMIYSSLYIIGYSPLTILIPGKLLLKIRPLYWAYPVTEIIPTAKAHVKIASNILSHIKDKDKPVLYLAEGFPTYFTCLYSYSRYYYPLPLQRAITNNLSLKNTLIFKQTLREFLDYKGEYIIKTNWFPLEKIPELNQKISSEYEVVLTEDNYTLYKIKGGNQP